MTADTAPILPDQGQDVTPNPSQVTLTENTPLLSSSCPSQFLITGVAAEENLSDPATYKEHVVKDIKWIVSSSVPASMTYFLQYSFAFVSVLTLGHLGTKELGAATLAITTNNVIGLAPALGYASALDTFCSTAFTASADKRMIGFHLQRGLLSVIIHFCMVFPFLWNIEWVLLLAHQDLESLPPVRKVHAGVCVWHPTMDAVRVSEVFPPGTGRHEYQHQSADICGSHPRHKQLPARMVPHNWHWIPRISFGVLYHAFLAYAPGPGCIHLIQQGYLRPGVGLTGAASKAFLSSTSCTFHQLP